MAYRGTEVCAVYPGLCWCHTWCFWSHSWMSLYSLWTLLETHCGSMDLLLTFSHWNFNVQGLFHWSTALLNSYSHISNQFRWQISFSTTPDVLLCKDPFLNYIKHIIHFFRFLGFFVCLFYYLFYLFSWAFRILSGKIQWCWRLSYYEIFFCLLPPGLSLEPLKHFT